jgi:hypothetical protein
MDPLSALGSRYGTDKVSHGFSAFYSRHLEGTRSAVMKVLEIGVLGGASLRMWRDYFPMAEVHGFDRRVTGVAPEPRIRLHEGDQASRPSLNRLIDDAGSTFDVIVDDGGHTMEQQQVSLAFLFPHLRPGGVYLLEDLHTSFFTRILLTTPVGDVSSYPTGADTCRCTTYALVDALCRQQPFHSDFMSAAEEQYLVAHVESAQLFDRDGDRTHVTSAIRKRAGGSR